MDNVGRMADYRSDSKDLHSFNVFMRVEGNGRILDIIQVSDSDQLLSLKVVCTFGPSLVVSYILLLGGRKHTCSNYLLLIYCKKTSDHLIVLKNDF